ncbi:MAG: PspC domain-containing protein [Sphingobacteriales bacterium]
MEKKLYRDEFHKKVGGVCAGLADYFTVDVAIVRVLFVLACILHGGGLIVYIVLWIALPKRPYGYFNPTVDYTVPPQNTGDQATGAAGNTSFGNTSFGNTSFQNAPYSSNPFPNEPFQPPHRTASTFSIIAGVILIVIGGSILLSNFDIIPDWDIEHLWPIAIIAAGCVVMISASGFKSKKFDNPVSQTTADDKATTNTNETNPPADDSAAV